MRRIRFLRLINRPINKIPLIILALFVAVRCTTVTGNDESSENLILDYDQLTQLLDSREDTFYIINFWQSTCKPCIREMPYFNHAFEYYKDYNMKIIMLSLDGTSHYDSRFKPFLEKYRIDPEVKLLNAPNFNLWLEKVDKDYWGTIPATLIYNKSKDIRYFINREFEPGELEELLAELLES